MFTKVSYRVWSNIQQPNGACDDPPPLSPTNHLLLLPFISVGQGCSSFFPGITTPISFLFSFSTCRHSQPSPSPPADVYFPAVHRVTFLFLNCPVLACEVEGFAAGRVALWCWKSHCVKKLTKKEKSRVLDVWDHCRCLREVFFSANSLFSTTAVVTFSEFGAWSKTLPKSMRFFALTLLTFGSGCRYLAVSDVNVDKYQVMHQVKAQGYWDSA